MLNTYFSDGGSIAPVLSNLVKPLYQSYCFANLPATIYQFSSLRTGTSTLPVDVFEHSQQRL